MKYDVVIVGGGMAGLATAARLQSQGLETIVLEAHGQPGGCAGLYRRKKFCFDVGATTLVDFEPGGVGGELLESIGMSLHECDLLPGYKAWLPDREVVLYRDRSKWQQERIEKLGSSQQHQKFWQLTDRISQAFWLASRRGIKLPIQNFRDFKEAVQKIGFSQLHLSRYLRWTMKDALQKFGLYQDTALVTLLAMLIEDTVHSSVDEAPLINSCLGINLRGAGLSRAKGGMAGFWKRFVEHYRGLGGILKVGNRVEKILQEDKMYRVVTRRGDFLAPRIVSAVPAEITMQLSPPSIAEKFAPYVQRDRQYMGGAIVVFLGVPETQVAHQELTHHQLYHNYQQPLGNGNNMFISVSSPGDTESAPEGHRSVMISTHCAVEDWENLSEDEYQEKKQQIGENLIQLARKVYPDLAKEYVVKEIGTPRTYYKYTHRPRGAVGGVRQNLQNTNQNSLPHSLGISGFWQVGDSTWPGLGTVACSMNSRIVAREILREMQKAPNPKTYQITTPSALRY